MEGFPSPANKIALKCTQLCVGGAGQGAESGRWPGHTTWSLSHFTRLQWLINFISSDESFGKISKEDNNDTYTWDRVADKSWGNRCINTDSMIAFVYVK